MTTVRPAAQSAGVAWTACGASVTGSMHQQRGLGCDDAYSFGVVGDFVVAAVADGAGSVSGTSAWGAHVACQSVLDDAMRPAFVEQYRSAAGDDAETLVRVLFDGALDRVHRQAQAMAVDAALLSTTLCVALATRNRATFGQIGDGVIAVEGNGSIDTLLIECKDEYANTTSFLQSERAFDDSFRTVTLGGVTAFALSTDGMSYKITNVATGEPYEPFFRGCWQHLRSGAGHEQFAAMLGGIEDDQTGDDKTMVLAVIGPDTAGSPNLVADGSAAPQDGNVSTVQFEAATVPLSTGTARQRRWRWGRR